MTKRQINKIKKLLNMKNQEELKKDIKRCEEFYILKKETKFLYEQAPIILENFQDTLHLAGLPSASMEQIEIINTIKESFNA